MDKSALTGVILAGGRASRMGGTDKGLLRFAGQPLIEHTLAALRPQVGSLLINANRNTARYAQYGYPVIADDHQGYQGPLAGMARCLEMITSDYMLALPCDSPYLPADLARRMCISLQAQQAEICTVHNGERLQPVFALIPARLGHSLHAYLNSGQRKIDQWYARHMLAIADFSDQPEAFLNINTPEDIAELDVKARD